MIRRKEQKDYSKSIFDGLSWIETTALIVLPMGLVFIFYMMLDIMWWIKLPIAIGTTAIIMLFLRWISTKLVEHISY